MNDVDVVIVGGGPTGLAAAVAARHRGLRARLLEASESLGGMAASFTVAGQRVDYGSHRLHPAASARVLALLGGDLQVRRRNGRLRLRDRWVAFPFRPSDLLANLPRSFVVAAGRDVLGRPLRRPRVDSYAEVVRVGLGPTALAEFHGPMATKLWGLPPEQLSGELALRRLPVLGPSSLARRIGRTGRSAGRTFLYPPTGFGQISERLADAATDAGAELVTDCRVSELHPADDAVVVCTDEPNAAPLSARRVLWAAPLPPLLQAVGHRSPSRPPPPSGLAHRGIVLVYLVVPSTTYSPYDAHYVADRDVVFSRLSEPRNYRDGPDPPGQTVLCAELPCSAGDTLWTADADELQAMVLDGMARCGLTRPTVVHTELRRLRTVYPVLTVNAPRRRGALVDWADALPGVTVLGRQGRAGADNLHHVLEMALAAVDCLDSEGRWDSRRWTEATERFDTFVVED